MTIVGIDLGTTNSLVAVFQDGEARVLPNVLSQTLTPSVVGLDDNGAVLVGQAAKERLITHPDLTASNFKRDMGTSKVVSLGDSSFRPEELSALVLRSLKADAEAFLNAEVTEAVVSVPAYFNDAQRKATQAAGKLAGLKVERLINEPTAAAIAYGLHRSDDESTFLVFDLGGGTFDVSVLELFEGVMEVHASAGDNFLGGEDFTRTLATAFLAELGIEASELTASERNRLSKQAELCKTRLSIEEESKIELVIGSEKRAWPTDRAGLEKLSTPLIQRMRQPIERAMRDARLRLTDLNAVVLVGGATRMPLVRSLAAKMFGHFPLSNIHPEETVALGTAIQAGLKSRDAALSEIVLTDTCPYSLGVDVARPGPDGRPIGTEFLPIIERNTVVPVSREKQLYTIRDDQTQVELNIYQGESRIVSNNVRLGNLHLSVPKGKAGEQEITVRFTYDINGLLEVDTKVTQTGLRKTVVIEDNPGVLTAEEIEERLRKLEAIKIHPREKLENRTIVARGERIFEESLGETREYVRHRLAHFEAVMELQDNREVDRERAELKEALDKLEEGASPW